MAEIVLPHAYTGEVKSVSALLEAIKTWHKTNNVTGPDTHRRVWYRGHQESSYLLQPGVYRSEFSNCCKSASGGNAEEKRLTLEREMLSEFRTSGAAHLDPNAIVDLYFIAQHYGMPTRLLDWTTNPLAALFFAVKKDNKKDGDVFVMDAPRLVSSNTAKNVPNNIVTMRHPYVTDTTGLSFWHKPKDESRPPLIVPIRPDSRAGRISQQSSCFTLHVHLSSPTTNRTLGRMKIPAGSKTSILEDLRKLNINEFTIYNDLDHLSLEIRRTRGLL